SPVSDFRRALAGLPAQKGHIIQWSVQGHIDSAGQQFLDIHLSGFVVLTCQRCLQDFGYCIDTTNTVLVVDDELELDVDADDPDANERTLGSTHLNALELVEDEPVLSIPYVPRHQECTQLPQSLKDQEEEVEDEKPNPSAALSKLKK